MKGVLSRRSPHVSGLANVRAGLLMAPTLGERGHRSLARRLVSARRATYVAIVAARPHPRLILASPEPAVAESTVC
jgi:hypothetical protein